MSPETERVVSEYLQQVMKPNDQEMVRKHWLYTFAGQAMGEHIDKLHYNDMKDPYKSVAEQAVKYAEALLKELIELEKE